MAELREHDPEIFSTGWKKVDAVLGGGIAPGEMAIVGASTSHGKTLVALQMAYAASERGLGVLCVSEEMTPKTLADRAILAATEIESKDWRKSWDRVFDDVVDWEESHAGKVMIPEVPCHSIQKVRLAMAEAVEHYGVKIAIVDYLQLLSGPGQSRYEQVSNVSRELKQAAVEHNIAVYALAQLNRSVDTEAKGMPAIHHLCDSGQIERDADVILLLHWPHRTNPEYQPANEYRIIVAKNRNRGVRGERLIKLQIQPMRQRVVEQEPASMSSYEPAFAAYNEGEF